MNRILQHLSRTNCCRQCQAREHLQAQLDRAWEQVTEIEAEIGTGTVEFCIPSAEAILADRDPDERKRGVCVFVSLESEFADPSGDMREYAIREMRRIARELRITARRLEGGETC